LISGTISLTPASILQHEELSITRHPDCAKTGAQIRDTSLPAENNAIPGLRSRAFSAVVTVTCFPRKGMLVPAERSEATAMSSLAGKFLSSSIRSMVRPTSPVAPATMILSIICSVKCH
jgi:hypothetical protein